ncbi:MAG: energy-coupling factor transporter transmembrane component T [Anaerovoracaceae bacterium]|jgi:energy-coupling factor transport system permease protein
MRDAFSQYHPTVNFLWFTMVILFTMFFMHPMCLLISLVCSVSYTIYLHRGKASGFLIKYLILLTLITALLNPVFNHQGATIVGYLWTGNPLTLESILYGGATAIMLISVICWFSCFNQVITSDKIIYIFGQIMPSLSLFLSMALRFVPRFKHRLIAISLGQKAMGRNISKAKAIQKITSGVKIVSILITGALEDAIITADSMKSRGYGLPGRKAFSIFRFSRGDKAVLLIIGALSLYIIGAAIRGYLAFQYFPYLKGMKDDLWLHSVFSAYLLLCLIPLFINLWEDCRWKRIQSEI